MRISVAMCTYNGEKYLKSQLDSILNQTILPDEIIICDDCSKDSTINIITAYQKKHPIIKLFINETNLGLIKNFEKAINQCTDGLVFLSDQDDIWYQNKIEEVLHFLKDNPDKRSVFHNLTLLYKDESQDFTIWDYLVFDPAIFDDKNINPLIYAFAVETYLTGAAMAFYKYETISLTDKIDFMLHDFQLLLHFKLQNSLGILNKSLGYYRLHDSQQVGAQIQEKQSVKERKNAYLSLDFYSKCNVIMRAINRNKKYLHYLSPLSQVNDLLKEDLLKTKKQMLSGKGFFNRKKILYVWLKHRKYETSFKEFLFL